MKRLTGAVAGAATGALLVGAAWLAGAGPFTPLGTQPPLAFELLAPFDACASCHAAYDPQRNIDQLDTWSGSMMANAARDPIFWAALDVANQDVPGIGEFCLRCHAPTGWLGGRADAAPPAVGDADGCALAGNLDEPDNDFSGVSCHLCHRMTVNDDPPPGEDPVYFENARFWIDDEVCPNGDFPFEPCRHGPYDYPIEGGPVPPPHEWAFSPYHVSGDQCGNCHNVTNPLETLIDESGTDTGIPYPVERTFKEWQQSVYSDGGDPDFATCQNCHMPDATGSPVFACSFGQNDRTGDLPVHRFAGGNAWVPAVLKGEYPNLQRDDAFDATVAWALELLQEASANIALTAPPEVGPGGNLPVEVEVTNLTGHKLPTGYVEGRRMWLRLEVRDGDGDLVFESGAWDPATGELADDPQLKVYERINGVWNSDAGACEFTDGGGRRLFHFVLDDCIALDNRIPPLGFTGGADAETRPVNYVYPETSPGSGVLVNFDVTGYQVPVPPDATSPLTVEARLLYQTASKEYVEFLRDEAVAGGFPDDCIPRTGGLPGMSRGEYLYALWEDPAYGRSPPVEMEAASAAVVVEAAIFADGFESGDTGAWSGAVP